MECFTYFDPFNINRRIDGSNYSIADLHQVYKYLVEVLMRHSYDKTPSFKGFSITVGDHIVSLFRLKCAVTNNQPVEQILMYARWCLSLKIQLENAAELLKVF